MKLNQDDWRKYLVIFWIALAVLFAIIDYSISDILASDNSQIGKFVEQYGEVPGFLLIIYAISALFLSIIADKSKKLLTLFFLAILYFISQFGFIYWLTTKNAIINNLSIFSHVAFVFVIVIGLSVAMHYFDPFPADKRKQFSILVIGFAIIYPLLIVSAIKILWGRKRFEDLSSKSEFTPWYQPLGITGDQSFPSGHAALAWMLLPLYSLDYKNKIVSRVVRILIVAWGVFVSVGRILIGAHYASDVLFSTMLGIFIYSSLKNKNDQYFTDQNSRN